MNDPKVPRASEPPRPSAQRKPIDPAQTGGGGREASQRYAEKRERIIDAAIRIMNDRGVHGLKVADLARAVELNTSSITYYFRFKEQIAAAAFEDTLARIERLVEVAAAEPTPQRRVASYVAQYFDLYLRMYRNTGPQIADLSDMRALEDEVRLPLTGQYSRIFRGIRGFFGEAGSDERQALNTARAQVLTETIYWLRVWAFDYSYGDLERVQRRILDIFEHGLTVPGNAWNPEMLQIDRVGELPPARAAFLRVATRVISGRGYRGASVERIAAELNVTKGSFYHHLDAKDDLVLDCYRSSYAAFNNVLQADVVGSQWHKLTSVIATLLDMQLAGDWPLLRTTALLTLPPEARSDVLARSNRVALSIAGIISDGINDGTIGAVDPLIAAQIVLPGLNAAYEQHKWAQRFGRQSRAIELYASTLAFGLFDDRLV